LEKLKPAPCKSRKRAATNNNNANGLERFLVLIGFLTLWRTLTRSRTTPTIIATPASLLNLVHLNRRPTSSPRNLISYDTNLRPLLPSLLVFPTGMLKTTGDKNTITLTERLHHVLRSLLPTSDVEEVWLLLPFAVLLESPVPSQPEPGDRNT
jgi:hypothetical protein